MLKIIKKNFFKTMSLTLMMFIGILIIGISATGSMSETEAFTTNVKATLTPNSNSKKSYTTKLREIRSQEGGWHKLYGKKINGEPEIMGAYFMYEVVGYRNESKAGFGRDTVKYAGTWQEIKMKTDKNKEVVVFCITAHVPRSYEPNAYSPSNVLRSRVKNAGEAQGLIDVQLAQYYGYGYSNSADRYNGGINTAATNFNARRPFYVSTQKYIWERLSMNAVGNAYKFKPGSTHNIIHWVSPKGEWSGGSRLHWSEAVNAHSKLDKHIKNHNQKRTLNLPDKVEITPGKPVIIKTGYYDTTAPISSIYELSAGYGFTAKFEGNNIVLTVNENQKIESIDNILSVRLKNSNNSYLEANSNNEMIIWEAKPVNGAARQSFTSVGSLIKDIVVEPVIGHIEVTKVDNFGNRWSGVTFELSTRSAGSNSYTKIASGTTDGNGVVRFNNLSVEDEYYIRETNAPFDLMIDTQEYKKIGKVQKDKTLKHTQVNDLRPGDVTIIKKDQKYGHKLYGAEYTLTASNDPSKVYRFAPTAKQDGINDQMGGEYVLHGETYLGGIPILPKGEYYILKETVAPTYHNRMTEEINVVLEPGDNEITVYNELSAGKIVINKIDDWVHDEEYRKNNPDLIHTGNPIKDVTFKAVRKYEEYEQRSGKYVYKRDTKEYRGVSNANGVIELIVEAGQYEITEIEAPAHVKKLLDITEIEVKKKEGVTVDNYHQKGGNDTVFTVDIENTYEPIIKVETSVAINTPNSNSKTIPVEVDAKLEIEYNKELLPESYERIKISFEVLDKDGKRVSDVKVFNAKDLNGRKVFELDVKLDDGKTVRELNGESQVYTVKTSAYNDFASIHNYVIEIPHPEIEIRAYMPKRKTYTQDDGFNSSGKLRIPAGPSVTKVSDDPVENLVIRTERNFVQTTQRMSDMIMYYEVIEFTKPPIPAMATGYGFANSLHVKYQNEYNSQSNVVGGFDKYAKLRHEVIDVGARMYIDRALIDNNSSSEYPYYTDEDGNIITKSAVLLNTIPSTRIGNGTSATQERTAVLPEAYVDKVGNVSTNKNNPILEEYENGGRKIFLPVWLREIESERVNIHQMTPQTITESDRVGINEVNVRYTETLRIVEWMFEHIDEYTPSQGKILLAPIDTVTFNNKFKRGGYNIETKRYGN